MIIDFTDEKDLKRESILVQFRITQGNMTNEEILRRIVTAGKLLAPVTLTF